MPNGFASMLWSNPFGPSADTTMNPPTYVGITSGSAVVTVQNLRRGILDLIVNHAIGTAMSAESVLTVTTRMIERLSMSIVRERNRRDHASSLAEAPLMTRYTRGRVSAIPIKRAGSQIARGGLLILGPDKICCSGCGTTAVTSFL